MLGNPNTPQGERSLEDTEKESVEEGAPRSGDGGGCRGRGGGSGRAAGPGLRKLAASWRLEDTSAGRGAVSAARAPHPLPAPRRAAPCPASPRLGPRIPRARADTRWLRARLCSLRLLVGSGVRLRLPAKRGDAFGPCGGFSRRAARPAAPLGPSAGPPPARGAFSSRSVLSP